MPAPNLTPQVPGGAAPEPPAEQPVAAPEAKPRTKTAKAPVDTTRPYLTDEGWVIPAAKAAG